MRYIGSGVTWDRARADATFEWALSHWQEHGFGWRSALDRTTGEWLGFVGLNYVGPGAGVAPEEVEMGWWVIRPAWGRGYASEGAARLRDEAFEQIGLDQVIARLQAANIGSARVAEKLGMRLERETTGRHGESKLVYVLSNADWPDAELQDDE
jgi:RimJ/RimL family protein N-acetyltransferase